MVAFFLMRGGLWLLVLSFDAFLPVVCLVSGSFGGGITLNFLPRVEAIEKEFCKNKNCTHLPKLSLV
ncbi:hypothetical protein RchiOBHm_Chr6g0275371 [Rosa chinensis]|uniref:Uncharacterized protein n=1 Tax=Rosa chinensis TaxID=74649 RepID=A0A2P6PS23_ROSCH|nr:hypothetical protein RchiOBHm_Chr6g0275371 [Rosa chinensis]